MNPAFKSLWRVEHEDLSRLDPALLCPLQSKGTLGGILTVSKRQSKAYYTRDDVGLLMAMATGLPSPWKTPRCWTI